jgi:hypothetical protein
MAANIMLHLEGTTALMRMVDGPQRERVAALQQDRLRNLCRGVKLASSEASAAIVALNSVGFADEDVKRLQDAIIETIDPLEGVVCSGQKFQNYESLMHFLPQSTWDSTSRPDGPLCLFKFLADKLGLDKPNEGTLQVIAIVLLIMSEGQAKVALMTGKSKNEYLKAVKRWWAEFCSKRPRRSEEKLLWVLPASPTFMIPELAQRAFAQEPAAGTKISVVEFEGVKAGSWMRIHPSKSQAAPPQQLALQVTGGPPSADASQFQMMTMMMTCFKDMLGASRLGQNAAMPVSENLQDSSLQGLRVYTPRPRDREESSTVSLSLATPRRDADCQRQLVGLPVGSASVSASMIMDAEPSAAEGVAKTNGSLAPPSVMDIEDATNRVLDAMAAKSGKAKKENANAKKKKKKEATTPVSKPQNFHDSSDDDDEDDEDGGLPTKKARNTKPKTIAKTAGKRKKAPVAKKAPMKVQHEKSRNQFLVRTVPSKQFKYGKGCAYPSEELARKAADKHALRH